MLRPIGRKKEKFGDRCDGFLGFKESLSESASKRSAARFPGRDHVQAARAQVAREHSELGRFPATINAFERYEFSLQTCLRIVFSLVRDRRDGVFEN